MKDSSAKSRLSDEGVRKKEPSVSKIDTKELSEPKLKASDLKLKMTQPKVKTDTLGSVKTKKRKEKEAKNNKIRKVKPAESAGKSSMMKKKTVDSSFVAKVSPKAESIKKKSNSDKQKSHTNNDADASYKNDVEIALDKFEINKICTEKKTIPEKLVAEKESTKVKEKRKPAEKVDAIVKSADILEVKVSTDKVDVIKESTKVPDEYTTKESDELGKETSTNTVLIPVKKERRRRLSLKEEKLLLATIKAEKKLLLISNKALDSKEGPEVPVISAVTVESKSEIPVKISRERKKSFKARQLLENVTKTALPVNQTTKLPNPSTNLSKIQVPIENTPVKIKVDEPKVTSTLSEKKDATEASSMIKFTYEKSTKQESEPSTSEIPPNEIPPTETSHNTIDELKPTAKLHTVALTLLDIPLVADPVLAVAEFATDIEGQLQALEDGLMPGEVQPGSVGKATPTTPVKADVPEGFQAGARMEALEISTNKWYSVKVVEVDWAENEVLIHFEKWSQRFDEWIQMNSSRLRPCQPREQLNEKIYHVGETVMATWMNSQKYPAKVRKMLNNDFMEVLFFDGFTKTMRTNKIAKCVGNEGLEPIVPPPPPALMSKLERRERKRKIQSVAELFHTKRKKHKTKKLSDLGVETKPEPKPEVLEDSSSNSKKLKYTDLTNISDNEGEKTYIDLNTSFTHNEGETDMSEAKVETVTEMPTVPTKRAYKRKKLLNATTEVLSPESSVAKEVVFPFKGRKHNEAIGSDYDSWEPEGEEAYVVETADGLRRSLVVKDDRLPPGWAKHTIQRRSGNSAGKWDVFLVSPGGRRFRSRKEMQVYFSDIGQEYRPELFDFTLRKHKPTLKLASSMSLDSASEELLPLPGETLSPAQTPQRKYKLSRPSAKAEPSVTSTPSLLVGDGVMTLPTEPAADGTVYIGNLQVQLDPAGAYVCPSDTCSKHFRRENLLQMHIKHYHPELSAFVGTTPNVADLAYARTVGAPVEDMAHSGEYFERLHRVEVARKQRASLTTLSPPASEKKPTEKKVNKSIDSALPVDPCPVERPIAAPEPFPKPATSTPLRDLLRKESAPLRDLLRKESLLSLREQPKAGVTAGIKTLLPIVRSAAKPHAANAKEAACADNNSGPWLSYLPPPSDVSIPGTEGGLGKSKSRKRRLSDAYMDGLRKRKHGSTKFRSEDSCDLVFSPIPGPAEESPLPAGSRLPPGTMKKKNPLLSASLSRPPPDFSAMSEPIPNMASPAPTASSPSMEGMTEEQLNKRDIINCTCGVMEEDGLMIQCDLCLCWQHGYCNNIERETEVPEKYVCYICLHPARERMSAHFLHDQDWLNEGVLPSLSERTKDDPVVAHRTQLLRQSHDLAAGLLQLQTAIKSLRVKVNVANTPDHPKLYLWAKPWEKCSEPKLGHPCLEPDLASHEIHGDNEADSVLSVKDEIDVSVASLASEKDLPKPQAQEQLTVKAETKDAANLGLEQCKTELDSVEIADEIKKESSEESQKVDGFDVKPAENVPINTEESMEVDEFKEAASLDVTETPNPVSVPEDGKLVADDGAKSVGDFEERLRLTSTPLMEGVASTSSQVPLIESSLQSNHFGADKNNADLDNLHQALTHAHHEPAMTNGTDISNGHLDPSQLLNFPISKLELLRFANSIADNFKAAVTNHSHPRAPEPEKPIDPRECRLLLLDHIELKQREVKHQLQLLEDQLSALEAEDPEPPTEETLEFFPQTKQTVKMLLRDLNTLKKISEIN